MRAALADPNVALLLRCYLGDGEVDDPAGALGKVVADVAGTEQGGADEFGEHLSSGRATDGVGARIIQAR